MMATTETTTCSVKWCVCVRVERSTFCAIHKTHPDLHPAELEDDEELVLSPPEPCENCKGTGKCPCCDGDGDCDYQCRHCDDWHSATCHTCDGGGECVECDGAKSQDVRKKEPKE